MKNEKVKAVSGQWSDSLLNINKVLYRILKLAPEHYKTVYKFIFFFFSFKLPSQELTQLWCELPSCGDRAVTYTGAPPHFPSLLRLVAMSGLPQVLVCNQAVTAELELKIPRSITSGGSRVP